MVFWILLQILFLMFVELYCTETARNWIAKILFCVTFWLHPQVFSTLPSLQTSLSLLSLFFLLCKDSPIAVALTQDRRVVYLLPALEAEGQEVLSCVFPYSLL